MEEVYNRIDDFSKQQLDESRITGQQKPAATPVDLYDERAKTRRAEHAHARPHGAPAFLATVVASVVGGDGGEGLARAYRRARDDSDSLRKRGESERARILRQQYMEEQFLPALEIVVNSTSPDEVLNSKKTLSALDDYVLTEGSGAGYTAAYIRKAYGDQLGNLSGHSDAYVRSRIQDINLLLNDGQVRAAFGVANRLKAQIDDGEHIADDLDYELIGRIVAYYSF